MGTPLSGTPPWQWPAWWANCLTLGAEMGEEFGAGLARAAGVEGQPVDVKGVWSGDSALKALGLMAPSVATLNLDGLKIAQWGRGKAVESLDLSKKGVARLSKNAVRELSSASATIVGHLLGDNSIRAKCLDLSGNGLTEEVALTTIASGVNTNTILEKLNFDGFELNIAQLKGIVPVTTLDLSDKSLGNASTIVIAKCIEFNAVLTKLDLARNNIGPEGATAIAKALEVHAVLTHLDLSENQLCGLGIYGRGTYTAVGITAIAKALEVNAVLTELNLSHNNIRPEGATAIAKALEVNAVLTDLKLKYNNLGTKAEDVLRAAKSASLKLEL